MSANVMGRVSASNFKSRIATAVAIAVAATSAMVMVTAAPASAAADSVRSGQMYWSRLGPTTADFVYTGSWRSAAFDNVPVGGRLTPRPGCVDFGYTTANGPATACPDFVVSDRDSVNGAVFATARFSHQFPAERQFTVTMRPGDRVTANHANNPGLIAGVRTVVKLSDTTRSPVVSTPATVECRANTICEFDMTATDPDGQPITYFMATPDDGGSPSYKQPPNATVSTAGHYRFDTRRAGPAGTLYSTQVLVQNLVNGNLAASTPFDFMIKLTPGDNLAPYFVEPPTPSEGAVLPVTGAPISFTVKAQDDQPDVVSLTATSLPTGATFTPGPAGNPVQGQFNWNPPASGTFSAQFMARDNAGLTTFRNIRFYGAQRPFNDRMTAYPALAHVMPGPEPQPPGALIPKTLVLTVYVELSARLEGTRYNAATNAWDVIPLSNRPVTFTAGATAQCTGTTDVNGFARCGFVKETVMALLAGGYTARFAGDSAFDPATANGPIVMVGSSVLL